MAEFFRKLREHQDGAVMAYTAILLPIFIGFIALGLDVATWHIDKRNSQTMADAAAMAAAYQEVALEEEENGPGLAAIVIAAAKNAATMNGFDTDVGETIEVNNPPLYGFTAGNSDAIEVLVRTPLSALLSSLLIETAGSASSRAVVITFDIADGCIWALNDSATGAITVSGGATVTVGCGVFSNSHSADSIQLNGTGACVTATSISAAGGVDGGSGDCFDPAPITNAGGRYDPLRNLPEPESLGCDVNGSTRFNGGESGTLSPGTYCGDIFINTHGTVTFEPGLYILDGADLTINSQSTVVGTGVTIFMTDSSSTNITINGGANVQLSAPSSGDYQGILVFQSPNADPTTHLFNGGSDMNLEGIIYTPKSDLQFTGNASASSEGLMLISDEVVFTGTTDFGTIDTSDPGSIFYNLGILEGTTKLVE